MFRRLLFIHWKQFRMALVPFVITSFGLPLVTVHWLGTVPGMPYHGLTAYSLLARSRVWLPLYPVLAAAIGITLALSSWNWDHQLGHVYALSLPLPRWKYAALKMAAGAVLAVLPAAALWVGALVASASLTLPPGLHAYPTLLAVHFLSAVLLAYAVLFAMAAGTVRTTVWIVTGVVVFLVVGSMSSELLASHFAALQHATVLDLTWRELVSLPGPFHVFLGNWALIDV